MGNNTTEAAKTPNSNLISNSSGKYNNGQKIPRFIPATVRAEKIAKGLCYYCDKPYERGHKCENKETQLFLVEVLGKEDPDLFEVSAFEPTETNAPCISFHAMTGGNGYQTMRVTGFVGRRVLQLLIDSGSTHNFLDSKLAQKLGCLLEPISTLNVVMADGYRLPCTQICKNFKWRLQNSEFFSDVYTMPIGGCDMVLGIQWLSTLGTIRWNFKQLSMDFEYLGKHHALRGTKHKMGIAKGDQWAKDMSNVTQICMVQVTDKMHSQELDKQILKACAEGEEKMEPAIDQLLAKYAKVFSTPVDLPPKQGPFDHSIPLKSGSQPVNIRPERHH